MLTYHSTRRVWHLPGQTLLYLATGDVDGQTGGQAGWSAVGVHVRQDTECRPRRLGHLNTQRREIIFVK